MITAQDTEITESYKITVGAPQSPTKSGSVTKSQCPTTTGTDNTLQSPPKTGIATTSKVQQNQGL